MCLILTNHVLFEANEDIVCYKFVERTKGQRFYHTPFRYKRVSIGETYLSSLHRTIDQKITIGLHSFKNIKDCIELAKHYNDFETEECIVQCTIPKGSFYYVGTFDDAESEECYASSAISYDKIVKKFKFKK